MAGAALGAGRPVAAIALAGGGRRRPLAGAMVAGAVVGGAVRANNHAKQQAAISQQQAAAAQQQAAAAQQQAALAQAQLAAQQQPVAMAQPVYVQAAPQQAYAQPVPQQQYAQPQAYAQPQPLPQQAYAQPQQPPQAYAQPAPAQAYVQPAAVPAQAYAQPAAAPAQAYAEPALPQANAEPPVYVEPALVAPVGGSSVACGAVVHEGPGADVLDWLASTSAGLDQKYGPALIEYGYDSMNALTAGTEDDLVEALGELELNGAEVKVKKPHQKLIVKAFKELK